MGRWKSSWLGSKYICYYFCVKEVQSVLKLFLPYIFIKNIYWNIFPFFFYVICQYRSIANYIFSKFKIKNTIHITVSLMLYAIIRIYNIFFIKYFIETKTTYIISLNKHNIQNLVIIFYFFLIDDFRIFVGDLGNEVSDDALLRAFSRYPSLNKARVVRDKRTKKTKGYGFVSFKDPQDYLKAMREMNGKDMK